MTSFDPARRKLVLKMSISLDGFVAGPNGELDWVFRSSSPDSRAWVLDTLRSAGVHLIGSGSYREMAAFWSFSDTPFSASMNELPKIVFSRTGIEDGTRVDRSADADAALTAGRPGIEPSEDVLRSWAAPTVASGDLVEEIHRLKAQQGGPMVAHGGVRFARSLVASGLVDEYRLAIHPVVLGEGQPLFAGLSRPADLRLLSATPFNAGVVGAIYAPATRF